MRLQTLPTVLATLAICSCSKQDPGGPATIQRRVTLARAATCESLADQVHETAVRQMRTELDRWKDAGFGYGLPASSGPGPAAPAAGGAPASYSTTNTQEIGRASCRERV